MTADPHGQNKNDLGSTYVRIGAACPHLAQLDLALKDCHMAADSQLPTGVLAFTYNEIAIIYRDKSDNQSASKDFINHSILTNKFEINKV